MEIPWWTSSFFHFCSLWGLDILLLLFLFSTPYPVTISLQLLFWHLSRHFSVLTCTFVGNHPSLKVTNFIFFLMYLLIIFQGFVEVVMEESKWDIIAVNERGLTVLTIEKSLWVSLSQHFPRWIQLLWTTLVKNKRPSLILSLLDVTLHIMK